MDRDEALELLLGGKEGVAEWNRRREAGESLNTLMSESRVLARWYSRNHPTPPAPSISAARIENLIREHYNTHCRPERSTK